MTRSRPDDLALALLGELPKRRQVRWPDTQLAKRQRRLDRLLEVATNTSRRWLHIEWQRVWQDRLPYRVFEYHALSAMAAAEEGGPCPTVESVVVLLSGRNEPWPAQMTYRTTPEQSEFSGVTFRVEAVYQRTVDQLRERGVLWTLFVPLSADATERAVTAAARDLKKVARDRHELADLGAAMVVLAEADGRSRGLGEAVRSLLGSELVMQSSIYTEGKAKGKVEGLRAAVEGACKLLDIKLTPSRRAELEALDVEGLERLHRGLVEEHRWPRHQR